ncbi:MAG: hypothetical protein CSA95_04340 [Bacteroidetes bacterium]|nr:MAG: hypothetical protein CSA95_04340 [Bacteroidota bacterium]
MFKILIGEISSNKAIVIAKFIKKHYQNIQIFSYDNLSYTRKIHTKYVDEHIVLKKKDTTSYIKRISEVIADLKIDLFLPIHSDYIGEIIKRKYLFGNTLWYLGEYKDYEKLHIKKELQKIAERLEINVPKEYTNIHTAKIPFVGKPTDKSSSKGVIYFNNENKINQYREHDFSNYIFQDYISGIGCGYSVYSHQGKIEVGFAHKRLLEFPYSGGSSIYRESFKEGEMRKVAEKILSTINWTGFAMFEFKYTKEGQFILIEVNPRIWGSINQGLMNGVNYFKTLIPEDLNKGTMTKSEIRTYMSPQIYFSLLQSVFKLEIKNIILFLKNFSSNKSDVSFWNDYKGYISIILRLLHRIK